jgi:hypothetical protein
MGANLDTRTYNTDDKTDIRRRWDSDVEESQHSDGNSYSGCIGMFDSGIAFIREVFDSARQAYDYISENHQKWDNPLGVPFRIAGSKKVPSYVKNAKERYDKAQEKHRQIVEKVHQDILNAKSKFVSCKVCSSKLNRSFLRTVDCPICNKATLISKTGMQRIEKARQKTSEMLSAWKEACTKATKANCTGTIGYVVGGLCSS